MYERSGNISTWLENLKRDYEDILGLKSTIMEKNFLNSLEEFQDSLEQAEESAKWKIAQC